MTHPTVHQPAEDSVRTVRGRDKARNWLQGIVENFQAAGGQIKQIETGVSGEAKSSDPDAEQLVAYYEANPDQSMKQIASKFGTTEARASFLISNCYRLRSARRGSKSTHRRSKP